MRTHTLPALAAIATAALIGTAIAAEIPGAELKELHSGKTLYMEASATATAGAGQSAIFYGADGNAIYKTGKGEIWQGPWTIKDNTVCIEWKQGPPNNPCSRYDKQGDVITIINVKTGQPRATIKKTAAGNAENLKP